MIRKYDNLAYLKNNLKYWHLYILIYNKPGQISLYIVLILII